MTFVRHALAGFGLLAIAATAQAQTGGYLSAGGGQSRWDVDCTATVRCDKTGSALRLAGGYRFGGGLAVEGLYLNLGKTRASVGTGLGVVNAEIKGSAVGAGMAVFLPLGAQAELSARLGVASVAAKATGSLGNGPVIDVGDERKAKVYAGLGLAYNLNPTLQLQIHWDSTRAEVLDDEGAVGALTVGIGVRF